MHQIMVIDGRHPREMIAVINSRIFVIDIDIARLPSSSPLLPYIILYVFTGLSVCIKVAHIHGLHHQGIASFSLQIAISVRRQVG